MKLVTFTRDGEEKLGVVDDQARVVDLCKAYGAYLREVESNPAGDLLAQSVLGRDMIEFLKRGATSLDAAKKALAHIGTKPRSQWRDRLRSPTNSSQSARAASRRANFRREEFLRSRFGDVIEEWAGCPRGIS
jgi:hypothetical protein